MDPTKFDSTATRTIVHWPIAVEQYGATQLIEDDTRMASYAKSYLWGKDSELTYSALMADSKAYHHGQPLKQKFASCINRRKLKYYFRCVCLARDKSSDPSKTMCRSCATSLTVSDEPVILSLKYCFLFTENQFVYA